MSAKRVVVALSIFMCITGVAVGQTEWVDHPDNPVLGPGEPGEWDDGGRGASAVLLDGSTYHMWFSGGDQEVVFTDIGHATSTDGVEWTMDPANPVLTRGAEGEWDDYYLFSTAVIHDGTQFHMWYSGYNGGIEQGGYATSPDGSVWTKYAGNPVMEVGPSGSWDDWIVRPGGVIVEGDMYRMWYAGWRTGEGSGRIGYAESSDGIHWTKNRDPVLEPGNYPGSWEPPGVGNPFVAFDGSTYHMWYVGGSDRTPPAGRLFIGYAFSSDGIQWTKHRDNPVVQTADNFAFLAPVLFDGTTWHMWYSHWDGTTYWLSYATSPCCPGVAGMSHSKFIPAAAVTSGSQGAFFQTDVDLNNAGSQPVQYQFMWLPRGENCSEPMTSEEFALGAGMSVRYANVLSEVFNLEPDSVGALLVVSSSPDLLAMSRTYNTPSSKVAGTYGQAIPAIPPGDFIHTGERRRILFASENADLRTNVGCQSSVGGTTAVSLDLYAADGAYLGRQLLALPPWGNNQLNRVFEDYQPVDGYVDVWTPMSGSSFYCYGSVLDNVTSDPTTILPQ